MAEVLILPPRFVRWVAWLSCTIFSIEMLKLAMTRSLAGWLAGQHAPHRARDIQISAVHTVHPTKSAAFCRTNISVD